MSNKSNDPNSFSSYNVIDSTNLKKKENEEKAQLETENNSGGGQPVTEEPNGPTAPPTYQAPPSQAPPQMPPQAPPVPPNYQASQNYGQQGATYQNPPDFSNRNQMAGKGSGKKPGNLSNVVFWILLVVIGGFALLIDLTAKAFLGAGLTALVIIGMVALRGKLVKKPLMHALSWVGVVIVLFGIMAFTLPKSDTKPGAKDDFSVNTNTMVQSGGVEAERAGFASEVDPTTLKPTVETSVFKPDTKIIYYSILLKRLPAGTTLKATITYDGQTVLEMEPSVFNEEITERYYTISIPRAEGRELTEGKYTVTLIGTNNDKQVLKAIDTFTVAK